MQLPDLATIGSFATAAAVIVALVFGIVQMRLQAAQRRDVAAAEILRGMLNRDFIEAVDAVLRLPDDAPPELIEQDEPTRRAALYLDFVFESAGTMVHSRLVPLHEVDKLMGGMIRAAWRKLRRHIQMQRDAMGAPSRGEWFQWLAERMEEDPAPGKREGAHVAFRDWTR